MLIFLQRPYSVSYRDYRAIVRSSFVLLSWFCFLVKLFCICPVLRWFRSYSTLSVDRNMRRGSTTSTAVHLICNGTAPGYLQSCFTRLADIKTTVAVLCFPSSGSTVSSSVYCRQTSLPSFRRQQTTRNDIPSHVISASSLAVFRQRLKIFLFSRSYPGIVTWLTLSYCIGGPSNNWHYLLAALKTMTDDDDDDWWWW